jgi:glycosyltransferase involved in cell wall biosynthesis
MKITVLAHTEWAIGRVHNDIAEQLKEYTFKFYNQASFYFEAFLNDAKSSDIIMTTLNNYIYITSLFKTPEEQKKIVIVAHGISEIKNVMAHNEFKEFSKYITYSVTSDVIYPYHPMKPLITPNSVNPSLFKYCERSGSVNTLGWCGAYDVEIKRFDWSYKIAKKSGLPLSMASGLSFDSIKKWYESIDILLITSGPDVSEETGPLPAFEAIACGVLVVGTSVGNFSHIPGPKFSTIEDGVICINSLKNDPEYVRALAKEQYIYVMNHFSSKVAARGWKKMFDQAFNRSRNVEDSTNASQVQFQFSSPLT